jgi:PAS domain-containing protein
MEVTKLRSALFLALKQQVEELATSLGGRLRSIRAHFRARDEELRARQNHLQSLLISSCDAIVVTDTRRRVVAANPIALHFWGISKANIKHFTLDAFLSTPEIPNFDSSDSPSKGRQESHGECKIRRLDGRMLVADYIFVPNFTPFRHLCRVWNDREWPSRRRDHALISTSRSVFHTQPLTGTRVLDARLSGR